VLKLADLQADRARIVREMRSLNEAANESGDLTDEQQKKFDGFKVELAAVEKRIARQTELDEAERRMAATPITRRGDGRYEERAREFSLVKAINARLGEDVDDGFEREISAEVKRRSGRKFQGIAVPDEYFQVERRTLLVDPSSSPPGAAADLYPTAHRGDLFIDLLRAQLVTGRLGATILNGLVGDQDIPRQTASSTAQWVAEDGALSETDAAFDDVTLSPKTVGAVTSYSRRTLINAVPSIEAIVRNDLVSVIANAIDLQALTGTGAGGAPTGITGATGAHSLTLAGPTWAQILAFISNIEFANADIGGMGWALNPHAVAKLRATLKETGDAGAGYLMDEPGMLAGFPAVSTSALPGNPTASPVVNATVIFGAFSQLLIGYWSATDVLANPYESTAYLRGRVLLRAMRDVDVAVRHGASFAFATDLVP
jgi:hypothetical protein